MCVALSGHAVERHYTGVAYDVDTAQIRYREEHWLFEDKGTPTRLVLYRCSNGQPFARKTMRYVDTPWTPEFEMIDNRDGYIEGARRTQNQWLVYVQRDASSARETATLPARPNTVIDAGFDDFVRIHWNELTDEHGMSAAFVMPERLAYLNVKLQPAAKTVQNGVAAQQFRMSLAGWLGAIAPSITLTYALTDQRLIEFVGLSNVRDARGKRQRVRIEFADHDAAPASREQIRAAETETLVSHCPEP